MPSTPTIAFIGAGNMGSSLIGGLVNNGHPVDHIWAADPSEDKLALLRESFQIHTTTDNNLAAEKADALILAIKPQYFAPVVSALASSIQQRKPLIISIAAGIGIATIQQLAGANIAIVRAMPNTPALISCGATALFANPFVTTAEHDLAESLMRAVGITVWVLKENIMDTVTALSGSGPAYFFLMMEALQQAAEELGMPSDTARLLTLQTALGAARMAMESGMGLSALRQHVTSPGGTTERALSVLEDCNIRQIFRKALQAAKTRAEELGEQK